MTVTGVLCAAAALGIEKAIRRLQVKRRKNEKDWLRRRMKLGHNRTKLHEGEEENFASLKNDL